VAWYNYSRNSPVVFYLQQRRYMFLPVFVCLSIC